MADQDRKASRQAGKQNGTGKQPITRHPLFPATVAIWFGALFGLGSLVIRPTLLESFVVATHIDVLVPAAAPPLGMTARILVALLLAGLGALAGGAIARRIGRPPQEKRERNRGMASVMGRQVPAEENAGESGARRRPLAIDDSGHKRADVDEPAPVPGSGPQILDLQACGLDDETPADEADAASSMPFAAPSPEAVAEQRPEPDAEPVRLRDIAALDSPLDLADFNAEPDAAPPVTIEASPDVDSAVVEYGPDAPPARAFAAPSSARPFAGPSETPEPQPAPATGQEALEPMEASRIAAETEARARAEEKAREEAAATARKDAMLARLSGSGAARLFDSPTQPESAQDTAETHASDPLAAEPVGNEAAQSPVEPAPEAPAGQADDSREDPHQQEEQMSDDTTASRIATADLDDLSHDELLARLEQSMLRRRNKAAETPAEPEAVAPPEPAAVPEPTPFTQETPPPVPHSPEPPVTEAVPSAEQPTAIPAALRPIALDDTSEADDALPAFVPGRLIGVTQSPLAPVDPQERPAVAAAAPAAVSFEQQSDALRRTFGKDAASSNETIDEDEAEDPALEEGYSSLLNLSRPTTERHQFVRIEEPEPEQASVEPVVIFPNQAANNAPQPAPDAAEACAETPAPAPTPAPAAARPFDSPGAAAIQGENPAPNQDPAETERALRAALSSLQRMSGAA